MQINAIFCGYKKEQYHPRFALVKATTENPTESPLKRFRIAIASVLVSDEEIRGQTGTALYAQTGAKTSEATRTPEH